MCFATSCTVPSQPCSYTPLSEIATHIHVDTCIHIHVFASMHPYARENGLSFCVYLVDSKRYINNTCKSK